MWGLESDGTFISTAATSPGLLNGFLTSMGLGKDDVYSTVMLDLQKVRKSLSREIQRFQFSVLSDTDRGKRLLFLFQKDLLPGVNAMIMESKGKRDFVAESQKVEPYQKMLAWAFVLTLNAVLLFYIYLFAIQQSSERQEAWFQTFCVWLGLEVILMSTVVVYVTHFLIPSLVMQDLQKVKKRLLQTIREYKRNLSAGKDETKTEFNVADYFFVSSRLSSLYPDLTESKIIRKFSSPWPHQSYQRTRSLSKSYSKRFSTVMRSISMITVFFLKGFLSVPPGVQDMFMQLATIVVTGNVFSALVSLYHINPILPVIPILVVMLIVHFLTKLLCRGRRHGEGQLDPVAAKETSAYSGGRKAAVVAQTEPGAVRTEVPHPPTVQLKSRRQSVQHGVATVRALERHQTGLPNVITGVSSSIISQSTSQTGHLNLKGSDFEIHTKPAEVSTKDVEDIAWEEAFESSSSETESENADIQIDRIRQVPLVDILTAIVSSDSDNGEKCSHSELDMSYRLKDSHGLMGHLAGFEDGRACTESENIFSITLSSDSDDEGAKKGEFSAAAVRQSFITESELRKAVIPAVWGELSDSDRGSEAEVEATLPTILEDFILSDEGF